MSKQEKRQADMFTPLGTEGKKKDQKKTPAAMKSTDQDESLSKKLHFEKENEVAGSLIDKLWPLLEVKMNNWVKNTLNDIVETIAMRAVDNYVTTKDFDEKITNKVKNDIGKSIQFHLDGMNRKLDESKAREDDLEQYSRRNSIRITGVEQTNDKGNTDELVVNIIKKELGVDVEIKDLDRSHRVGKAGQTRQIIAKKNYGLLTEPSSSGSTMME